MGERVLVASTQPTDFEDLHNMLQEHKASLQAPFTFISDIQHVDVVEADVVLIDAGHLPEALAVTEQFAYRRPSIPMIVLGISAEQADAYLSFGPLAVLTHETSLDEISAEIRRGLVASRWLEGSCLHFWNPASENQNHSHQTPQSLLRSMPVAFNFAREQAAFVPPVITGANLSHTDLSRLQLHHLSMNNTNFNQSTAVFFNAQRASLTGSNFSDALFIGSDFSNADLTGCNFQGAEFVACRFTGAQLNGADLVDSYLVQCLLDPGTIERPSL